MDESTMESHIVDPTPSVPSLASHASWNPSRPIIQPRQKKNHTNKCSAAAASEVLQEKWAEFIKDLTDFQDKQQKVIQDLAQKHSRKPQYMEAILVQQSLYKKKRAPNIQNAKVFRKAKELNEGKLSLKMSTLNMTHLNKGRDEGEKLGLSVIQEAVKEDPTLQNLSPEEEKELVREFEEVKAVKKTGVRISNRAANLDYQQTVTRIENKVGFTHKLHSSLKLTLHDIF